MEGVASSAKALSHEALSAAEDLAGVFFSWVLPIIMVLVGIFVVNQIGLSGAIGTAFSDLTNITQTGLVLVADLAAAGIWGGVAAVFWSFGGKSGPSTKHSWASWIMRPIGGLFTGFALGELLNALAGKVGNGSLGGAVNQLTAGVSNLAKGG